MWCKTDGQKEVDELMNMLVLKGTVENLAISK